jgi:catechol 2,3-dioxygenase-like lactoylglutathione lyase family enzyme
MAFLKSPASSSRPKEIQLELRSEPIRFDLGCVWENHSHRVLNVTGSDQMILNPDHVTIAVADVGPAIEFFALLGFKKNHVATIDGGVPARYMGMPGMKAQHITLALEGAYPPFEIQLLKFDPPPGTDPGAHPTNLRQRGFNHLAFRVDDIEAETAHLVANGVKMLSDEMDYISRKLRLFEGPEGITLELVQRDD